MGAPPCPYCPALCGRAAGMGYCGLGDGIGAGLKLREPGDGPAVCPNICFKAGATADMGEFRAPPRNCPSVGVLIAVGGVNGDGAGE